ncbi:MAG: hypothetical protein M3008_13635 [Chloroflexota bacterium]|nr:hypothetical protein [Chloroflexota bacterium]
MSAWTAPRYMPDPRRTLHRSARLLGDAQGFLDDHPRWNGFAQCGVLVLPIVAILLFTPRLRVLAIPEVLVFAGMAGWLCSGRRDLEEALATGHEDKSETRAGGWLPR